MNIEAMRKVRDFLMKVPESQFDMRFISVVKDEHGRVIGENAGTPTLHNCNTVGCIAGWTPCALGLEPERANMMDAYAVSWFGAANMLGLSGRDANWLFTGLWSRKPMDKITKDEVVQYLSRCIDAGKILEQ